MGSDSLHVSYRCDCFVFAFIVEKILSRLGEIKANCLLDITGGWFAPYIGTIELTGPYASGNKFWAGIETNEFKDLLDSG
jgi:hypothetical protein